MVSQATRLLARRLLDWEENSADTNLLFALLSVALVLFAGLMSGLTIGGVPRTFHCHSPYRCNHHPALHRGWAALSPLPPCLCGLPRGCPGLMKLDKVEMESLTRMGTAKVRGAWHMAGRWRSGGEAVAVLQHARAARCVGMRTVGTLALHLGTLDVGGAVGAVVPEDVPAVGHCCRSFKLLVRRSCTGSRGPATHLGSGCTCTSAAAH